MNQNNVFLSHEGDAWYDRNHSSVRNTIQANKSNDVQFICKFFNSLSRKKLNILEIGCSNGVKLESICSNLCSSGFGIDPSSKAVEDGNNREKLVDISLYVGTGDNLNFSSCQFDLVYFAFCLYLFDRNTLLQSLAEADRVLKPGGFLVITDFDPGFNYKKPYAHHKNVHTYKQDYSELFLRSGLYYLAEKHSYSHKKSFFDESYDERVSTSILFKEINPYINRE